MKKRTLIKFFSVALTAIVCLSSCEKEPEDIIVTYDPHTLSVSPSAVVHFNAEDNEPAELIIATNAEPEEGQTLAWSVDQAGRPSWVGLGAAGNKLTITAEDNGTGETRSGSLTLRAGTAKPVKINISQMRVIDNDNPPVISGDPVEGTLRLVDNSQKLALNLTEAASVDVHMNFTTASNVVATGTLVYDDEYLAAFNAAEGMEALLYPKDKVTFSGDGAISINAGARNSRDVTVDIAYTAEDLLDNQPYLIPLYVADNSENLIVSDKCRVNLIIRRKLDKTTLVKNIVWYEVNNTNPLNALEWKLSSGEYFYDAVVLFSSNIHFDRDEGRVYVFHNANCQALMDQRETYIKPLQDAGIKVYMSILGNHQGVTCASLTDLGAKMMAADIAKHVNDYGLDGCAFDDEWQGSSFVSSQWSNSSRSVGAASRLIYETDKAMREVCGEEKDTVLFYWNSVTSGITTIDGNSPGTFCDICNANYGGSATPVSGGSRLNCSFQSISFTNDSTYNGGSATESSGNNARTGGYGWYMWFNVNPVPGTDRWTQAANGVRNVARGLYPGRTVVAPTHYWKKTGEGIYDPVRYEFTAQEKSQMGF